MRMIDVIRPVGIAIITITTFVLILGPDWYCLYKYDDFYDRYYKSDYNIRWHPKHGCQVRKLGPYVRIQP